MPLLIVTSPRTPELAQPAARVPILRRARALRRAGAAEKDRGSLSLTHTRTNMNATIDAIPINNIY
jgi:hypothetical protein